MSTPVVRIPIVCPECGHECLMNMPVATAAAGLMNGRLELLGGCHHPAWKATDIECEQIRAYLSVLLLVEAQEGL